MRLLEALGRYRVQSGCNVPNPLRRAWGVSVVHAAGPQIKAFHPHRQCLPMGRPGLGTLIYCELRGSL